MARKWAVDVRISPPLPLAFKCRTDNDLYRVLTAGGPACRRLDPVAEAIAAAPRRGGVLILADGYPEKPTRVPPEVLDAAAAKGLRLYIEFPKSLRGLKFGKSRGIRWERAVVR